MSVVWAESTCGIWEAKQIKKKKKKGHPSAHGMQASDKRRCDRHSYGTSGGWRGHKCPLQHFWLFLALYFFLSGP